MSDGNLRSSRHDDVHGDLLWILPSDVHHVDGCAATSGHVLMILLQLLLRLKHTKPGEKEIGLSNYELYSMYLFILFI